MSYLLRWVRHNQSLASRSRALVTNGGLLETSSVSSHEKPLYQIVRTQPIMTPSQSLLSPPPQQPLGKLDKDKQEAKKDDIKYEIKFVKGATVKKLFKELYSLYGPLFVVCYIGVGLTSLGFFCSLAYFAIDLTKVIPDFFTAYLGATMVSITGSGGKYVMAYALHKVLLPIRLGASIYITRGLSRIIKSKRKQS